MTVENKIPVYEIDGADARVTTTLSVTNHYWTNFICLTLPDGKTITVLANQLTRAIANAQNVPVV